MLCVLDIEGDNVSVLEGVPENISPGQVGTVKVAFVLRFWSWHTAYCIIFFPICHSVTLSLQAFWAPGDTGVVFVGWSHEPFRLGLKYCPNRM